MKDNFSSNSSAYALYRPSYPKEFYTFLKTNLTNNRYAWDVGTGNGQVAQQLTYFIHQIEATDISRTQLENAFVHSQIHYSLQPAEKTNFPDDHFNLITVGQAIHWFDFSRFYAEVERVAADGAILALIGYDLIKLKPSVDILISQLYNEILNGYWDPERKYIDEKYSSIPFPFVSMNHPEMIHTSDWTFQHLIGYLNTWSAVKHYIKENDANPIDPLIDPLRSAWGNEISQTVKFSIISKIGRINK